MFRQGAIAPSSPTLAPPLLLKVASEGASLTSELNWIQSLGPRNEIDFSPFDVLKRGTRKSASVFLSLSVVKAEFHIKK